MKNVCILFTPGLDSFLCNYFLKLENPELKINRCYFDLNSKYSYSEINYLKYQFKIDTYVEIYEHYLNLKYLEKSDFNIPNRNILLATMAASIGTFDTIYINCMKDDRSADSNRELFDNLSYIVSGSVGRDVLITSKFWDREKSQAIADYISSGGGKFNLLNKVYSCFSYRSLDLFKAVDPFPPSMNIHNTHDRGFTEHRDDVYELVDGEYIPLGMFDISGCGMCVACFRRFVAIASGNLYVPFYNKSIINKYRTGIDEDSYPHRAVSTRKYIDFLDYYFRYE